MSDKDLETKFAAGPLSVKELGRTANPHLKRVPRVHPKLLLGVIPLLGNFHDSILHRKTLEEQK
jgi:hypothetical protein